MSVKDWIDTYEIVLKIQPFSESRN